LVLEAIGFEKGTATLKDQSGNPLSSRTVQIAINGVSFANVTTGSNGQASFTWSPSNTGNYTVAASYSATGSQDLGYEPSSASTVVNVKPQTIVNTQTAGSNTQSVTFNTQGFSESSQNPPSISITFPNPSTVTLSVGYDGENAQASANLSNKFGWHCHWWGCIPYWNVEIDASVSGVLSFQLVGAALGSVSSATANIIAPPGLDLELVGRGLDASSGIALAGDVSLLAAPLVPELAGAIVMAATVTATLAGAFLVQNGNTAPYKSYLYGMMVAPVAAPICILIGCPELPSVPGFELGLAIGAWLGYIGIGIYALWALGGWLAMIEVAVGFLLPALLLSLM
jgi:hypothetical protein